MSLLGAITGNEPARFATFGHWLGRRPDLALLAFNDASPASFAASIPYIVGQGRLIAATGAGILWSVPCPGRGQLEAIAAGVHDAAYARCFAGIVAASGGNGPVLVRLPWEFNLAGQHNSAQDRNGGWDPALFVTAWRRLALLACRASPRIRRIWCPNVNTQRIDPARCWPGGDVVEIVGQDFYMQARWNKPGDFAWFRDEARGLAWGAAIAAQRGKPFALCEWGMDDDRFAGDLAAAAAWAEGLGPRLHHHCWWDRPEVIDCRISDGSHPAIGAAYRRAFA